MTAGTALLDGLRWGESHRKAELFPSCHLPAPLRSPTLAFVWVTAVFSLASPCASADIGPVKVTADQVELDAKTRELVLRGQVELDSPPFHLSSKELRVSQSSRGVVVRGEGRIAFCPCLAQPLSIGFRGATIAPPGDLLVDRPTLEVFHVPVFWLPFFWLRSPGKIGLLAPDVAYRGHDGLFLGEGIHVPLAPGDTQNGMDLRAGAYLRGGFATEGTVRTKESVTTVRWDHLADGNPPTGPDAADGLTIDARGASTPQVASAIPTLAWDLDAIRGQRGIVSTTDVDAASRVFDRASGQAAIYEREFTVFSAIRATAPRGGGLGDLGAAGPIVGARRDGTLDRFGAYDVGVEGGALDGESLQTTSFGRASLDGTLATHVGPSRLTWSTGAVGDVAAAGVADGYEGGAQSRLEIAVPFERTFGSGDALLHRVEPAAEVSALAAGTHNLALDSSASGLIPSPPLLAVSPLAAASGIATPPVSGVAWLAEGSLGSLLGRWGKREGFDLRVAAGAAGSNVESAVGLIRWRGALALGWVGAGAEGAHVLQTLPQPGMMPGGSAPPSIAGYAVAAHLRFGPVTSLHFGVNVAGREGVDPVLARALTDAPLPSSMEFLSAAGWTGGARLSVPVTEYLTVRGGADGDLTAERLLAARGAVEFHDRCGCVVITANGAQRIGRPGVDVWLTVSLLGR
jgi:hypothetical protein